MKDAINHLKKDKVLVHLIDKYGEDIAVQYWAQSEGKDLFLDLVEIIVGQQLSMKAADSIFARVKKLFNGKITPKKLVEVEEEVLRQCGLSYSKARYIKGVGEAIDKKEFNPESLREMTNEEVLEKLVTLKGIGPWSAEMFLMFSLRRKDVFSAGDLGLRKAIANLYGIDREDLTAMEKLATIWSPYRTLACRYLWRSLENY